MKTDDEQKVDDEGICTSYRIQRVECVKDETESRKNCSDIDNQCRIIHPSTNNVLTMLEKGSKQPLYKSYLPLKTRIKCKEFEEVDESLVRNVFGAVRTVEFQINFA